MNPVIKIRRHFASIFGLKSKRIHTAGNEKPKECSSRDAMEVCSLHSTDAKGYEMRVGTLLDQLPEYNNILKSHNITPVSSKYPTPCQSPGISEMKRSHSERDANPKKVTPSTRLTPSNSNFSQKHKIPPPPSSSNLKTDATEFQSLCYNNTSSKVTDCEIFLGGSCNPTSWRRDIAIPILNHSGISFFNPQVASWCPELIAAENKAKDLANFLFFVIDTETRAVASMVEVAYLIAQGKNVILVFTGVPCSGHHILEEPITDSEIEDLTCAHELLRHLSARHEIQVFNCIRAALQNTTTLIRSHADAPDGENGTALKTEIESTSTSNNDGIRCSFVAAPSSFSLSNKSTAEILPKSTPKCHDVFLGGDISTSWRTEASSLFKLHGLSSWTPDYSNMSSLLDDERMEHTSLLFFYVSNSSRALETLILAAYYVALSRDVILCIENLHDDCIISDELLTKTAVKDYNRGRCYLRDVAQRNNVPIVSSLPDALDALVQKFSIN